MLSHNAGNVYWSLSGQASGRLGHAIVTDRRQSVHGSAAEPCNVILIVAAIVAIWTLGLLSLAFTLPLEFISPADPDDKDTAEAAEKGA